LKKDPAQLLLRWYDERHRDLPWRRTSDPYRVWISEVMLQQTRVETVIPYYEAFLARFPSVESLAAAQVDEVLASWSGLGYYRRARQLHRAAKVAAAAGGLPSSSVELLELPGIGPYTAAAVASIAFGEVVAVLDGNVERLLCRRLALAEDAKRSAVRRRLLDGATRLLDAERPGDSNQALMELGATVCVPRRPRCEECPLRRGCRGRQDPERYPAPRRRREVERLVWTVALVEKRSRVLFFRRPEGIELMAGLWELPHVEDGSDAPEEALAATYGGGWRLGGEVATVCHGVTYRSITLRVHRAVLAGSPTAAGREAAWLRAEDRARYGISSMFEKVFRALA
jgi:A/G-specific adenine glycosylase